MAIKDTIKSFKERYQQIIEFSIKQKDFASAYLEITNMRTEISLDNLEPEIRKYHSGLNFLASLDRLAKNLEQAAMSGEGDVSNSLEKFIVYLAQLELSIKSGNVFGR
jgi:hypothetical protein